MLESNFSPQTRRKVKEITLNMAPNMKLIAKTCFTKAVQMIDRFHVRKLALEALQEVRIKYRWEEIDNENEAILLARRKNTEYNPDILLAGDTRKQLLARSRYVLYKTLINGQSNNLLGHKVLFKEYPKIEEAYRLSQELRNFF